MRIAMALTLVPMLALAADLPVARLAAVQGHVLVARDATIMSATEGMKLGAGWRVLAAATGAAVVEFDARCRVLVKPGERFLVDRGAACPR